MASPFGRGTSLARQDSGQLIFKCTIDGRKITKRLPKRVISRADAIDWIAVNIYNVHLEATLEEKRVGRLAALVALRDGATTDGERDAAQRAVDRISAALPAHAPSAPEASAHQKASAIAEG